MLSSLRCAFVLIGTALCVSSFSHAGAATPVTGGYGSLFSSDIAGTQLVLIRAGRHAGARHGGRARHRARAHPHHFHARHILARRARLIPRGRSELAQVPPEAEPIFGSEQFAPQLQLSMPARPPIPAPARFNPAEKILSCEAAADIVRGYAFSAVTPTSCAGRDYQFEASRENRTYSITLDARNGEVAKVQKLSPATPP